LLVFAPLTADFGAVASHVPTLHPKTHKTNNKEQVQNTLLDIHVRAGRLKDAVRHFQSRLDYSSSSPQVDSVAHNILIKAYGRSQQPYAAKQLLDEMIDQRGNTGVKERPGTIPLRSLHAVLEAFAESNDLEKSENAMKLISSFFNKNPEGTNKPNLWTYTALLKCATSSVMPLPISTINNDDSVMSDTVANALALLEKWRQKYNIVLDRFAYTLTITLFLKFGNLTKAEDLLEEMKQASSFNGPQKPDAFTYNAFLEYWSRQGSQQATERVEGLIQQMHELATTDADPAVRANIVSYQSLFKAKISSLSSHNLRHEQLDPLLVREHIWKTYQAIAQDKIPGVAMDIVCYTMLLRFYCDDEDCERANALLEAMERSTEELCCWPQSFHYLWVTKLYLKKQRPDRARQVLERRIDNALRYSTQEALRLATKLPLDVDEVVKGLVEQSNSNNNLREATDLLERVQHLYEQKRLPEAPLGRTYDVLLDMWKDSEDAEKTARMKSLLSGVKKAKKLWALDFLE
jgi:pentatricopeptide repeat protein